MRRSPDRHVRQPWRLGLRLHRHPDGGEFGTPANPAGQYNGRLGGVPTLNPEIAKTYTLGVVLQPRFIPRFAFTVDYWNIKLNDAIQGYGADAIVTACSSQSTATFKSPACDLIVRSPGTKSIWLTPTGYVIDTPNNNGQVNDGRPGLQRRLQPRPRLVGQAVVQLQRHLPAQLQGR